MSKKREPVAYIKDAQADQLSKQTKRIRKSLFNAAAKAVTSNADNLRGFVLIAWDDVGEPYIAVNAGTSGNPVGISFLPTYTFSQMQRYAAIYDRKQGLDTGSIT